MPPKKRTEWVAGLFVLLGAAVVLGTVLWLGAADLLTPAYQQVAFYLPAEAGSTGLAVGSAVRVNDALIGRVERVVYAPQARRTLYVANLQRDDVKIFADADAAVVTDFLGNAAVVVRRPGDPSNKPAGPDAPVPLRQGGMAALLNTMSDIGQQLQATASVIRTQLDPDDREALLGKIHGVVDNLKTASADVRTISGQLVPEFDKTAEGTLLAKVDRSVNNVETLTGNLRAETDANGDGTLMSKVHVTLDDVNAISADARPLVHDILQAGANTMQNVERYTEDDIQKILADLRQANTEILQAAQNFSSLTGELNEVVTLNRDNIDRLLDNMALVSEDLKATAREIRAAPWRLLYRPSDEELRSRRIHEAMRAFSSGASEVDQAIGKLKALSKIEGTIPADDETVVKLRKQLLKAFEHFSKVERALWRELNIAEE